MMLNFCVILVFFISSAYSYTVDEEWETKAKEMIDAFIVAYDSGNLTRIGEFVTDDIDFFGPRFPKLVGRAAFLSHNQGLPDMTISFKKLRYSCGVDAVVELSTKFSNGDNWRLGHALALLTISQTTHGLPLFSAIAWSNYGSEPKA